MTLITPARAIELVPGFDTNDVGVMTDIVNACSALVEKYCNRTFAVASYDQLIDGTGDRNIILDNYPITQIQRVQFCPNPVVSIGNTGALVSRAEFRLDATNLILTTMASGVLTTRTIARSTCLTLADLAAAINAYSADGWAATALGTYSTWATADLWAPQGGQEVRWIGYGYLWHHTYGVPFLMSNAAIGEIVSSFGFTRGYQNYRVVYSAGFSTIPPEIQQATAELAMSVYLNREVNPNLQSETLGGYSWTNIAEKSFENLSIASRYALSQYRNLRIAKWRVC